MKTTNHAISGSKFNCSSHAPHDNGEFPQVIIPACSFSKETENKDNEDSVGVRRATDASKDPGKRKTKAKTKGNGESGLNENGSFPPLVSPESVKTDENQPAVKSPTSVQQVLRSQEDAPFLKACLIDDWQEDSARDVTDGVVNSEFALFQDVIETQDKHEESKRPQAFKEPNQDNRANRKMVEIVKVPKKDVEWRRMGIPGKTKENSSLAYNKGSDISNSSCVGECVVADDGANNNAAAVNGACGYQDICHLPADEILQGSKDENERALKRKGKHTLGLKGGRRDEFGSNYSSFGAANACTSESSYLGIEPVFLARHTNDDSMSLKYNFCKMDECEEKPSWTFCELPDSSECFSRNTASATTSLMSPAQTLFNPGYQPQQSFLDSYNGKFSSPEIDADWSLPPPPQFFHLPCDVPQEHHNILENGIAIGAVQSRASQFIDPAQEYTQLDRNRQSLGGQNTRISQTEIKHAQSSLSVNPSSTMQSGVCLQAEASPASARVTRQQERERKDRESDEATMSTNGESAIQPELSNSNLHISDDGSLAALERRVAEACSLVERVLKEREEREKTMKERERRQREERSQREQQERAKKEREAREARQRNESGEGPSTGSEEETPSQDTAHPVSARWLCEHYQRLCRVKFPCCGKFYPCHRCHNNSDECVHDNCKAKEAFYLECSVCRHQQAVRKRHTVPLYIIYSFKLYMWKIEMFVVLMKSIRFGKPGMLLVEFLQSFLNKSYRVVSDIDVLHEPV